MALNLEVRKTKIGEALKWSWIFELIKGAKSIFFFLIVVFFAFFLYGFIFNKFEEELNRKLFGLILIFSSLYFSSLLKTLFYELRLKNPVLSGSLSSADNIAEYLSFESARAVLSAFDICRSPEVSSTHLLCAVLAQNPKLGFILQRMLIDRKELILEAEK
jgi:hypothetical protein